MSILNSHAYAVKKDKLVYDATYPIDADAVQVTISADAGGVIRRGTILDFDQAKEEYTLHEQGGTPSRIVAEDTEYETGDTEVIVPTYAGGTFRASEIHSDPYLTETDIEALRGVGIHLK